MPASRARKAAVGMAATVRRKRRPRRPRPMVSRPVWRASLNPRSSIEMDRQPWLWARSTRVLIAARNRPSRVEAGTPSRSRGIVFRMGPAEGVAGGVDDPAGEVVGVQIDGQGPLVAQFVEARRPGRLDLPGGVQVPAAPVGVEGPPSVTRDRQKGAAIVQGQ